MAAQAMREPIGTSQKMINESRDEEFFRLFDKAQFETEEISAKILFEKFYENGASAFFKSFQNREKTLLSFRRDFGEKGVRLLAEQAEKIVAGKIGLRGFKNFDFGTEIDWHFDAVSGKRAPLKHWKQFDGFSIDETGDASVIRELNRCRHFLTLGAAFSLTNDERFAECFARQIESWTKENPAGVGINWSSGREIALRSISWIWALHFFKDSAHLTAELFLKTLASLYHHAAHIEKYPSTFFNPNTYLTGEALGLYYLGTQLSFFERAGAWRETGEKILLSEIERQILPDGVYFERSSREHFYATDFYTHFYILRELNGGENKNDEQSKIGEKLQASLDFLMSAARPDRTTPRVGVGDGGMILPFSSCAPNDFRAALSTGAALFRRGDYKFAAEEFAHETLRLLGEDGERDFENLAAKTPGKSSFAFKDGGYFVMRDGWAETDNYLLVDCGGAFSIDAAIGGKTLLADSGNAASRNTLSVDEPPQTNSKTNLRRWISQDRFDFFESSRGGSETVSGAAATKHSRSVLFLKNDYWIMRDFVETAGEHSYALDFHFAPGTNPAIETTAGGVCVADNFDRNFGSRLFSFGDNASWKKKENSVSRGNGKSAAPHFQLSSKGVGSQEFFTFLLPRETGFNAPEISEISLFGGRAFVLEYRDYRDIFVFTDGAQIVRTELFNTNFQFFWARLGAGESAPEEFVLVGGSYFSLGKTEIINRPQPLESASARRFGNRLNVRTDEGVFSVSLPQKKSVTYVLKSENQD